ALLCARDEWESHGSAAECQNKFASLHCLTGRSGSRIVTGPTSKPEEGWSYGWSMSALGQ
ncbi:MAG TPA: hypothetical protein VM910_39835, partial [Bradyrhizobium sp.]|nr:hypothetical protein [Bradyrhizobium sp.]